MLSRCALLCLLIASCADDVWVPAPPPPTPARTDEVELIGVSGRRLADGDLYRVPLNSTNAIVAAGTMRREAFVLINDSDEDVLVVSLAVVGLEGGLGAEWSLLAPTRARDVPMQIEGLRLTPGARIDFDVGVRPLAEGERAGTLELVFERGGRVEARVIELRARCARDPP